MYSKIVSLGVLYLMTISSVLSAKIIEIKYFRDLVDYVTDDTLLILDIDETLLVPKQMLGTDAWFCYKLNQYRSQENTYFSALQKTLTEWEAIRHLTEVKVVEEGTDAIVGELQNRNIVIMGLSTQDLALATRTILQLKSIDIDLSKTAPCDHDLYFNNRHRMDASEQLAVLYRKGIMFTSGTNKGVAVFKLFELAGYRPKRVVFVNDKAANIRDVEESVIANGIDFIGLRYGYGDERVASFRPEIAEIQWVYSTLGYLISDEEAEALLEGMRAAK